MSQLYEVVIFTASQRDYANRVIDLIDPKRRIAHRLYREHCVVINKQYFLKNIKALGRKSADIILVDVPLSLFRIIPLLACCSLTISTKSTPLTETKRTDNYIGFPPSSSTSTARARLVGSKFKGGCLNSWR
jgi:hypothetical protein